MIFSRTIQNGYAPKNSVQMFRKFDTSVSSFQIPVFCDNKENIILIKYLDKNYQLEIHHGAFDKPLDKTFTI